MTMTKVCTECSSAHHVHRGLCRSCRRRLLGKGDRTVETAEERLPRAPDLEPVHDQPWRTK